MATSKLALYNQALTEIGERSLSDLTENRPPRHALDAVYDTALRYALEQGLWNFAIRTQELTESPSLDPLFGYTYGFEHPDDLVRIAAMTSDGTLQTAIEEYADENGYWWTNQDTIYVSYVSDDTDYGLDLSKWTSTFERYVVLLLASRICNRETASETKLERLARDTKKALLDARSKDAMAGNRMHREKSNWLNARLRNSRINGTGRGL